MLRDIRNLETTDARILMFVETKAFTGEAYPSSGNVLPCVYVNQTLQIGGDPSITTTLSDRAENIWVRKYQPEHTILAAIRIDNQLFGWIPGSGTNCRTLYRVADDGSIDFECNFFFDASGWAAPVYQCDIDSEGNVYQAGGPSAALVADPAKTQPPLYTLRSWDNEGDYRWSWSENETGTVNSVEISLGVWADQRNVGPAPLNGCRVAIVAGVECVIVGESQKLGATGTLHATALRCDTGAVVWRVALPSTAAVLVDIGATRSLWAIYTPTQPFVPNYFAGFLTIDNSDGSVTAKYLSSLSDPAELNGYGSQYGISAAIDAADNVYLLVMRGSPDPNSLYFGGQAMFGIVKFPKDSTSPSNTVTSQHFAYFGNYVLTCNAAAGVPLQIIVGSERAYICGQSGIEVYSLSDLSFVEVYCRPVYSASGSGMFFASDSKIAFLDRVQGYPPPAIHELDLTPWIVWKPVNDPAVTVPAALTPFVDGRATSDGGSLWSQQFTCFDHQLVTDTLSPSTDCAPECCFTCFQVSGFGGTFNAPFGQTYAIDPDTAKLFGPKPGPGTGSPYIGGSYGNAPGLCSGILCWWATLVSSHGASFSLNYDPVTGDASLQVRVNVFLYTGATLDATPQVVGYAVSSGAAYTGTLNCDGGSLEMNIDFGVSAIQNLEYINGLGAVTAFPGSRIAWPSSGFPSTVSITPISCEQSVFDGSGCSGNQMWISVSDGLGGFAWSMAGINNCAPGCVIVSPVTIPTALNQWTTTPCQ